MNQRPFLAGLLVLSALFSASCEREMEAPVDSRTLTIKASLDEGTKTAYAAEKTFSWLEGDQISLLVDRAGTDALAVLTAPSAGTAVFFSGTGEEGDTPKEQAFYPKAFASVEGNSLTLTLPESFTPDPENPLAVLPLIGRRQPSTDYAFKTATAILKITLADIPADATAVVLSHENAEVVLSGTFSLPEGDALTPAQAVAGKPSVSILFTPAADGETRSFYFPIPAQTIPAGLTLKLRRSTLSEDTVLGETGSAVEFARNRIVNLSALGAEAAGLLVAYMASTKTKTSFTEEDGFRWVQGDEIDAVVRDADNVFSGRRYVALDAGEESRFEMAGDEPDGLVLTGWAFYPSRTGEAALDGGFALQWDVRPNFYDADKERWPDETELITIDLPSRMAVNTENPLGVIPQMGVRQEDFRYKFLPMTGILSVRVTDMTDDLDFISLTGDGAISGSFHLDQKTGTISQESVISANPDGLTLSFSGVGSDYTFYFPVPAGDIENLTITVGSSRSPEDAMVKTAPQTISVPQGTELKVVVAYSPKDLQWAKYADATYIDDFMWKQHSAYTADTPVAVEIERSGLHPERFRIANPYTTANAQFGYTPYTDGIVADPYLVFTITDDGLVRFQTFRLGIEDKDSGGRAMQITHPNVWTSSRTGKNSKVVSATKEGNPLEIELACVYSDPDDSSYMYSRDGEGSSDPSRIHISIADTTPESWIPVAQGEFIDDLLWPYHSWGTTRVPVVLKQSSKVETKFRIDNPYQTAAAQFGYTPYTDGIQATEYLELTLLDNNLVRFGTFLAGIEDKPSGGRPMKIWYPTDWGGSYDVSYNKVLSWRTDGLPNEIQLAAMYSDPNQVSYKYTKYNIPTLHLWFPEGDTPAPVENWSAFGTVHYRDLFTFSDCPYAAVQMDKSDLGRYRIANPYPVLAGMMGEEVKYAYDEYLILTIADDGLVSFEPLKTGLERYGWDFSISHPKELDKNLGWNKVLSYDNEGKPAILQLAPIYHQTDAITTGNKYSRDTYDNMVRILMPGVPDKSGLVVVEHVQYPMFAGEERQIMALEHPAGTIESWSVTCDHPELIEGYALKDNNKIYATMKAGAYTAYPSLHFTLTECVIGGNSLEIEDAAPQAHFLAYKLRTGGDDSVTSYRIPALVTTKKGTLIAAYDCRWDNSSDLQGDIDVGVSRSFDGGLTWEPMQIAMDMGIWGYEAEVAAGTMTVKEANQLNGIGDPCLLLDENTGELFCFAVWAHAHGTGETRPIYWSLDGFDPANTAQLMMVRSTDDGATWSEPVNLTRQVKRYSWWMSFQGPGRGITMKDGTLVVPFQHQENYTRALNSGIMYSTDHGNTWHTHNYARATTSESCVAEIEPGVLLLSMRDETNSRRRAAYVTRDLGRTWTAHAYDGKMIEPTCEASMLHVDAADNASGKEILLFANPHSETVSRIHVTIQVSYDGGVTWPDSVLLDTGGWLGYSCLTMIDRETIGILHESFTNSIIFQAVPLKDLVAY